MNDFLSALLERSNDRAPVLRPRRLSRFEPAGLARVEGFGEVVEERVSPVRREAGPRTETPAPVRPTERVVERLVPSPETPRVSPPAPPIETIRQTPSSSQERKPEPPRRADETRGVRREPTPSDPARPQPIVRQETTRRTTIHHTVERQAVERPKEAAGAVADGRLQRPTDALRPILPSAIRPVATPRTERPARPAAAPTIQVSIGRIEIRAQQAAPAAQARPARPSGPKLDLEQYLAGRNGSGR